MNTQPLKDVKPGEYFRRKPNAKCVFVKGAYDRSTKKFECHATDDINRFIYIPSGKLVFVGFCY